MNRIAKFKAELNRVFDDDLHTKQWHNRKHLSPGVEAPLLPEMKERQLGHDFGFGDYID